MKMDRRLSLLDENGRGLPGFLEGLNIEDSDRSLVSTLWTPDTSYQPVSYTSSGAPRSITQSPVSSPSRSVSRSQVRMSRRAASGGLDSSVAEVESASTLSQFDPPSLRSIFASGQPTSSISANTAQASMSTASPGSSSRPFAGLATASASRRKDIRATEMGTSSSHISQHTDFAMIGTEKGVDDQTTVQYSGFPDAAVVSTPQALSDLFVTSEVATPGQLSRETTYGRSSINRTKMTNDTSTLTGHLFRLGFEEGRHSDVTIKAFNKSYHLHKLLLDRVPYFSTAFCGPWMESSASEMALNPEEIDSNITQTAFELAVRRIYGTIVPYQEEQEAIGLFATGCWLDMPDLVESCIEHILRQMHSSSLHVFIKLVTNSYYGKAGDRILSSAKAMLCRDGWEMPYEYWDNIPAEIIREIIGGDPFYVPSEWERWFLALKLLNRRLRRFATEKGLISTEGKYLQSPSARLRSSAIRPGSYPTSRGRKIDSDDPWICLYTHPEVVPLLNLLDEGIHYVHLRFEQLQLIRSQKDILGVPLLYDKVISDALWMSMELRQKILNAHESDLELGLMQTADSEDEDEASTPIARPHDSKGKQREHSEDSAQTMSDSATSFTSVRPSRPRRFWIPNGNISCVMGGSREACATPSFASRSESSAPLQRNSASPEITDSAWAAGLGSSLFDTSLSASRNLVTHSSPRFTEYPPFRFCAEFPNPRTLKEKKRIYSQTVWYAGSMWNLYIQRINTPKNQQLGIYLHRTKDKEPTDDPLALTVDDRIGQLEREMLLRRGESRARIWRGDNFASLAELDQEEAHGTFNEYDLLAAGGTKFSSRPHKTSQPPAQSRPTAPPLSIPRSNSCEETLPISDLPLDPLLRHHAAVSTIPPYTDSRTMIKTYSKIYSPSKGGRLLSVYESTPDDFKFGKTWDWESSWMILDDGLDGKEGAKGGSTAGSGDSKVRYMVVIGNV